MENKTKWLIDQSHSEIAFKVRHLMIAHIKGFFKTFDACIYTIGKDFATAEIDLSIDAASIDTGDAKRDEHLRSLDFFDVINHRKMEFISSNILKLDTEGNYALSGKLTIKGISKEVKLNVLLGGIAKDPWGNEKAGFSITGKINRADWGLSWNTAMEAGGIMLSDDIHVSCDIELTNSGEVNSGTELKLGTEKIVA